MAVKSGVSGPWWNFSLTSGWLIAVLAVLAVAATVAAGVTWDVDRCKRTRRAGLLVAVQVMTALTLASAVNAAGGFYASLADLLGVGHGNGPVVRAGDNRADTVAVEPWLAKARRASGPGKGVWTTLTIAGKRTGYQLPAWVYVPDAYFDPAQSTRQYPVVELFDGYPGAPTTWDRQGHLPAMLDRLIAANRIPPMIFIAPTQNPTAGRDSECVDAVGGARADTYLTQDVPDAVIGHLRVTADRTAWSTMGYSTGGYCAVDLALRHPREYASAVSLDGYFSPAIDATTGDLFKHDATVQRGYTPAATIHDRRAVPLRFYLLLGDAEPRVGQAGRTFAAAVTPPDTVTVVNIPGGHNWGTWTSALPAALAWLAAALPDNAPDAAPSTPAPTGSPSGGAAGIGG